MYRLHKFTSKYLGSMFYTLLVRLKYLYYERTVQDMYNKFMDAKELNVKVGDRVAVCGWRGTVTEVLRGSDTEWNGTEYVKVPGKEYTHVQVHFDDNAIGAQYQDGVYGGYTVI